jgi:aminopeptidase
VLAHDPDLLQGQDSSRVATVERVVAQSAAPIFEQIVRNTTNWCAITLPVPGWSDKVFPEAAPESRDDRLWEALFEICLVNQPDPLAAWQDHIGRLRERTVYLNRKQYAALRYTGPGTDLTVGLAMGHVWAGGQLTSTTGLSYTANIPTEEVLTMPHRAQADGVVRATKPLSFGGLLAEDFSVTFAAGRVVKIKARKGEEGFRQLLETDEGAARLGEVALVPHNSPISRTGRTFYNILIDENASCHLALGQAYKSTLAGGEGMSDESFVAAGGNLSSIHLDFMIGSGELNVDGLTATGAAEPIMRNGEFTFA